MQLIENFLRCGGQPSSGSFRRKRTWLFANERGERRGFFFFFPTNEKEIEVGEGEREGVDGDVNSGFRREVAALVKRDVVVDQRCEKGGVFWGMRKR